jgi:hypothetical protein
VTALYLEPMNHAENRRAPKTFQLLGSDDGLTWETVLTVDGDEQLMSQGSYAYYETTDRQAFRYFRLNVDEVHMHDSTSDNHYVFVGEMELLTGSDCVCEDALIPVLTSSTSAPPIVIGESSAKDDDLFGIRAGWKAFDGLNDSEADSWVSDVRGANDSGSPEYIDVNFGSGASYTVTSVYLEPMNKAEDRRAPKTFQLLGSSDGLTWEPVMSVSDDDQLLLQGSSAIYPTSSSASYQYFRLNVDEVHMSDSTSSNDYVFIGEAQFFGCAQ